MTLPLDGVFGTTFSDSSFPRRASPSMPIGKRNDLKLPSFTGVKRIIHNAQVNTVTAS